jgi:hypothetical protein
MRAWRVARADVVAVKTHVAQSIVTNAYFRLVMTDRAGINITIAGHVPGPAMAEAVARDVMERIKE